MFAAFIICHKGATSHKDNRKFQRALCETLRLCALASFVFCHKDTKAQSCAKIKIRFFVPDNLSESDESTAVEAIFQHFSEKHENTADENFLFCAQNKAKYALFFRQRKTILKN